MNAEHEHVTVNPPPPPTTPILLPTHGIQPLFRKTLDIMIELMTRYAGRG